MTQLLPAPNQGKSPSEVERGKWEQDRGITLSSPRTGAVQDEAPESMAGAILQPAAPRGAR